MTRTSLKVINPTRNKERRTFRVNFCRGLIELRDSIINCKVRYHLIGIIGIGGLCFSISFSFVPFLWPIGHDYCVYQCNICEEIT